ncbi:MAG: 16S rRNA processing protein RimM [Clostridia bacterium]|nr:16S rRNA processing protein RimM [Clostridia bacterium]
MKQDFLEAGLVRNTHALRGEVKFECWLDGDQPLSGVKNLYPAPREENPLELNTVRRQGDLLLVSFCGIDSVEKAQIYKGKTLYVSRSQIDPRGEKVFFADLIGLPLVESESGREYGKISEISSRGAGELLSVRLPSGREAYFPYVKEWVDRIDLEKGVFVHAPEGIFD